MAIIKPFETAGGYTVFDNAALDFVMPRSKPNTWKIVCATLRKTAGWADPRDSTKRKESDLISLSQYKTLTGIAGRHTLINAIADALECQYLIRVPVGQSFRYAINRNFQIDTSAKIILVTSAKTALALVPKRHTQNKRKQTDKQKEKKSRKEKTAKINNSGDEFQPPLISVDDSSEAAAGPQVKPKRKPGRPRKNPLSATPVKEKAKAAQEPAGPDGGTDQTPQVAPNPPKAPAVPKAPKVQDPNEQHPAVVAVRELVNRRGFPYPETWPLIIRALGDTPDRERLKTCYAVWRAKDYRITGLAWALEWYANPPTEVLAVLAPAAPVVRRVPMILDQHGQQVSPEIAIAHWEKMEAARRAKLTAATSTTTPKTERETNHAIETDISAGPGPAAIVPTGSPVQ